MHAQLLEYAVQIGDLLAKNAIRRNGRITWPDLDVVCGSTERAGVDIFMGRSGALFFLASLCKYKSTERLSALMEQIKQEIRSEIAETGLRGHDFYQRINWGFCLFKLGELLDEQEFMDYSIDLVLAGKGHPDPANVDAYGGLGREIALLLALYHRTGSVELVGIVQRKSKKLLRQIGYSSFGAHLRLRTVRPAPALGFAHGSSGVLWLLAELYRVFNGENLKALAYQLLNYEESWFNIDSQENTIKVEDDLWGTLRRYSWCDLRYVSYPEQDAIDKLLEACFNSRLDQYNVILRSHPIAFCNGNPGILAARLIALHHFGDTQGVKQVESLLDSGLRLDISHQQHIFNVCCGIGGNIETYLLGHAILGKHAYLDFGYKMAQSCIENYEISGEWKTYRTLPNGKLADEHLRELDKFKYTFLKGIVGIGYFLLRLYDPSNTSSLLMPIEHREPDSMLSKGSGWNGDIILNLRRREISRYFGHTNGLFQKLLNRDVFSEYIETQPVADTEPEIPGFAIFLDQKIADLDSEQSASIMKVYAAERYRIEFERANRVIMDRYFELYLCNATNSSEIHRAQLQVQRDVKLFDVPELQSAYAFHINRHNQPAITRISQLQLMILKYLNMPGTVKDIQSRMNSDAAHPGLESIIQAASGLAEANIVQKRPLKPAKTETRLE